MMQKQNPTNHGEQKAKLPANSRSQKRPSNLRNMVHSMYGQMEKGGLKVVKDC